MAKKYTDELLEALADELDAWCNRKNSLWLGDFCREFDIPSKQFADIFSRTEKSARAYERARDWQESVLVRGGLLNKFNSSMTKFTLMRTHNWSEKNEVQGPLGWAIDEISDETRDLREK